MRLVYKARRGRDELPGTSVQLRYMERKHVGMPSDCELNFQFPSVVTHTGVGVDDTAAFGSFLLL